MGRRKINILVLGIGNILFQDEGIGAHFVHYLDEKYEYLHDKDIEFALMDGGTLAQRLIPEIVKYDEIIVVDCITADDSKVGDVYFFDFRKIPQNINWHGSAHEIEMLQTLEMIDMNGDLPNTFVLGIVPKRIADDTTFDLSDEVVNAVSVMEKVVLDHLEKMNIKTKKIKDVDIRELSLITFKRDMKNGSRI